MNPLVLSIGTTHPWNVAGVGRDAGVITEYGMRSAAVIVAVSAQTERELLALHAVPSDIVRLQLQAFPPAEIAAVRVGALAGEQNVAHVAQLIRACRGIPVVGDPGLEPSSPGRFADERAVRAIVSELLTAPVILTPNIPEAERFLGRTISSVDQMVDAAHALRARGPVAVLIKGGHLAGTPVCDVLSTSAGTHIFRAERVVHTMRGTGCTLAAAIACELVRGRELQPAVESAREFLAGKLRQAGR
ncbi:MAG: bifunctional hydroxymethylpyrimidine kinase/phosphomethylpyrimidine kinase [Vulcanimicrobiaceae bacterium]